MRSGGSGNTPAQGSVASVREREELRHPRRLEDHRVYVAVAPEFQTLGDVVGRALSGAGAPDHHRPLRRGRLDHRRPGQPVPRRPLPRRAGGRPLRLSLPLLRVRRVPIRGRVPVARAVQAELDRVLGPAPGAAEDDGPCGRTFAILRETRMAAVVCEPVGERDVEAMGALVNAVADVGAAIARGIQRGIEEQPADRRPTDAPPTRPSAAAVATR